MLVSKQLRQKFLVRMKEEFKRTARVKKENNGIRQNSNGHGVLRKSFTTTF